MYDIIITSFKFNEKDLNQKVYLLRMSVISRPSFHKIDLRRSQEG